RLVRLAKERAGRSRGQQLVRRQKSRGGEDRNRPAQQGRARSCGLRADRIFPELPGVAQERVRHCERSPALLLERQQGERMIRPNPAVPFWSPLPAIWEEANAP